MKPKKYECLSKESGLALVELFYKSGQKQKDFCISKKITYHSFQYWKQKHKRINSGSGNKFMPIKIANLTHNGSIKISINAGITIEVCQNSDLALLKNIVGICKSCG